LGEDEEGVVMTRATLTAAARRARLRLTAAQVMKRASVLKARFEGYAAEAEAAGLDREAWQLSVLAERPMLLARRLVAQMEEVRRG
jgi:hypothetical protein